MEPVEITMIDRGGHMASGELQLARASYSSAQTT